MVGQGFGTADGTVYAQFTNKYASRLKQLQRSQQVNHTSCTKLKYTVLSANKNGELMVLSARPTASELWGSPACIAYITKDTKILHNMHTKCLRCMFFVMRLMHSWHLKFSLTSLSSPVHQGSCSLTNQQNVFVTIHYNFTTSRATLMIKLSIEVAQYG